MRLEDMNNPVHGNSLRKRRGPIGALTGTVQHQKADPEIRRTAPQIRSRHAVVNALVGQGVNATSINEIRNLTTFLVSTVEDSLSDQNFVPRLNVALSRCETLFTQVSSRFSQSTGLPAGMHNFLIEAQALARLFGQGELTGHIREVAEAKLLVLKYLASSIDGFFSPQE